MHVDPDDREHIMHRSDALRVVMARLGIPEEEQAVELVNLAYFDMMEGVELDEVVHDLGLDLPQDIEVVEALLS